MTLRTTSGPSPADLETLRKIWGEGSFLRPQPVTSTQQAIRSSYEDFFENRLSHVDSSEALRDFTPTPAEWCLAMSKNSTSLRKPAPIGSRRSDMFGGSYDSGSGCYESSSLMGRRYSSVDASSFLSSNKAKPVVEDSRRSSAASVWEASSGYSSGIASPRQRSRDSPSSELEHLSPTRRLLNDTATPFFEALSSIDHRYQRRHEQKPQPELSLLQQQQQQQQQQLNKIHQEELELLRKKNDREQLERLYNLFNTFNVDEHEEDRTASAEPINRLMALKEILGAEISALNYQRKGSPVESTLDQLGYRPHRGVIGELHSKMPPPNSASFADRGGDFMSLIRNATALPSRPPNPYEEALETIEREAKRRRTSAFQSDATYTWKGTLAPRFYDAPTYASKVFVGGLPYDVTSEMLAEIFGKFGASVQLPARGRGHAYLVFDSELQVQTLLKACENKGPGLFYYWVPSRRGKDRKAQVIPWAIENSDWLASDCDLSLNSPSSTASSSPSFGSDTSSNASTESPYEELLNFDLTPPSPQALATPPKAYPDANGATKQNTVFVGALHGEITAEGLQKILSDLFGPIIHVGIDTDRNRYPNGSARVTFATAAAFRRAVLAEYVHIVTERFSKTIQLDAYIEDGTCSICRISTPVFCRHPECFRYYCATCFLDHRTEIGDYHPPVMRNRNIQSPSANATTPSAGPGYGSIPNVHNTGIGQVKNPSYVF